MVASRSGSGSLDELHDSVLYICGRAWLGTVHASLTKVSFCRSWCNSCLAGSNCSRLEITSMRTSVLAHILLQLVFWMGISSVYGSQSPPNSYNSSKSGISTHQQSRPPANVKKIKPKKTAGGRSDTSNGLGSLTTLLVMVIGWAYRQYKKDKEEKRQEQPWQDGAGEAPKSEPEADNYHTHTDQKQEHKKTNSKKDLFASCSTIDELNKRFRILARANHPDTGGSHAAMREVNRQYKAAMDRHNKP